MIVREQLRDGGDATPWENPVAFRELAFTRSVAAFESIEERVRPVFFDRGIVECVGYSRFLNVPVPARYRAAVNKYRYGSPVFVTPPWQEIYRNDAERQQSWDHAVEDYRVNIAAYREAGYDLVEVPRAPIGDRVRFVLERIGHAS